jgi:hypothetical protein
VEDLAKLVVGLDLNLAHPVDMGHIGQQGYLAVVDFVGQLDEEHVG